MRNFSLALLVLGLACASDKSTGPNTLNGTWSLSLNISNSAPSASCTAQATLDIIQRGPTLTGKVSSGSQTCTIDGVSQTTSIPAGSTFSGQVSGSSVSFDNSGSCSYTGMMSGKPTNRLSGDATCTAMISGTNYTFTGTWQATR